MPDWTTATYSSRTDQKSEPWSCKAAPVETHDSATYTGKFRLSLAADIVLFSDIMQGSDDPRLLSHDDPPVLNVSFGDGHTVAYRDDDAVYNGLPVHQNLYTWPGGGRASTIYKAFDTAP